MSGQGEASLGVVGGTESGQTPDAGGKDPSQEDIAIPPPMIPELADMEGVGAVEVIGKEASEAQEPGLGGGGIGVGGGFRGQGKEFGDASERPGVVAVAEPGDQSLPKRLFPSGMTGADGELTRLAGESMVGGLVQQGFQSVRCEGSKG
jgi:hypothetical protein